MKKIFLLTILLFQLTFVFGQSSDWGPWTNVSCYKGIQYSVMNIGYNKTTNSYWWNVRWRNTYNEPVSFDGEVIIGGENSLHGRFGAIKPGGIENYTSLPYKSSSTQFTVNVNQVCFSTSWGGCSETIEGWPNYAVCDNGIPNYKFNKKNSQSNSSSTINNQSNSSGNIDEQIKTLTTRRNELCLEVAKIDQNTYNNICDSWQGRNQLPTKEQTLTYLKEDIRKLELVLKNKQNGNYKNQVEEERLQKEQEAKKAKFNEAIQNGDSDMTNKSYDSAMNNYNSAKKYAASDSEKQLAEQKYQQAYNKKRTAAREERLEDQYKKDRAEDLAYTASSTAMIGAMAMVKDRYTHKGFSGKIQFGLGYEQTPMITNQNNGYALPASYSDKASYPSLNMALKFEILNNKPVNFNVRGLYNVGFHAFETGVSGAHVVTGVDGGIQFWYKTQTKFKLFADFGLYNRAGDRTRDQDAINNGTTATDDVREGEYSYKIIRYGGGPMFHLRNNGRETFIKPGVFFEKISFAENSKPTMSFSLCANIESELIVEFNYSNNYPVAGKINYPNAFNFENQNYFSFKVIRQGNLW